MMTPEEFLIEDLLLKNRIKKEHLGRLKENLKHIPVVPPDKVTSLSELLFMVASHISDAEYLQNLNQAEFYNHQSDISEYIHSIKAVSGDQGDSTEYPFEKEKELLSCIAAGIKGVPKLF